MRAARRRVVCQVLFLLLLLASPASAQPYGYPQVIGQGTSFGAQPVYVAPPVIVPPLARYGVANSAGWNTGYSAVTSTYERPNPLGYALGGSRTVTETTTRVVPNDALGQPMRGGSQAFGERNSAGWNTGYSVVTDTYERPNPLGQALGGSRTVTETTTRVVPNDAFGQPLQPLVPGWP